MSEISSNIGSKIRSVRKYKGMTIEQLATIIHKSKATLSKYETGEITLDIETLYDIANALDVEPSTLLCVQEKVVTSDATPSEHLKSPFFNASRLYFYFYDGRSKRLKDGLIQIHKQEDEYIASFTIHSITSSGRSSAVHYQGKVVYSDMLIRFSFVNQYNRLEEDLLYIFNPLELRDFTEGLLCGISSVDYMPCAFKCLVTLTPQEINEQLKEHLLFNSKELRRFKKMNMLMVDNRSLGK